MVGVVGEAPGTPVCVSGPCEVAARVVGEGHGTADRVGDLRYVRPAVAEGQATSRGVGDAGELGACVVERSGVTVAVNFALQLSRRRKVVGDAVRKAGEGVRAVTVLDQARQYSRWRCEGPRTGRGELHG